MLAGRPGMVRRHLVPASMVLAGCLALGVLIGVLVDRAGDPVRTVAGATPPVRVAGSARVAASPRDSSRVGVSGIAPSPAGSPAAGSRVTLQSALRRGVAEAHDLGGEAAAAVWVDGDVMPILGGSTAVVHRMWSMSKAVVTIAALKAVADRPDPVLWSAMNDAIIRSDNCAIRRVIVGLQDRLGGVAAATDAFERVLSVAHARIERTPQSASPESECVRYLDNHQGGLPGSDLGVAAEFGTAEWTESDAISFAHGLSVGDYGASGARLLGLMALPKQPPLEEPPPPLAPPPDWGAGAAFPASWHPAWKAGWGGSQDVPPHFLAGQIVALRLGDVPVAVTAIFLPGAQPATDNPGLTRAPRALELMFGAVRVGLEQEHVGGVA